jgi:hypothetical protein
MWARDFELVKKGILANQPEVLGRKVGKQLASSNRMDR